MRKRASSTAASPSGGVSDDTSKSNEEESKNADRIYVNGAKRSGSTWIVMFGMALYSAWSVYHYQFEQMPLPLSGEQAGKRGFSEIQAMEHVKALTELGPHPVGSQALDRAMQV